MDAASIRLDAARTLLRSVTLLCSSQKHACFGAFLSRAGSDATAAAAAGASLSSASVVVIAATAIVQALSALREGYLNGTNISELVNHEVNYNDQRAIFKSLLEDIGKPAGLLAVDKHIWSTLGGRGVSTQHEDDGDGDEGANPSQEDNLRDDDATAPDVKVHEALQRGIAAWKSNIAQTMGGSPSSVLRTSSLWIARSLAPGAARFAPSIKALAQVNAAPTVAAFYPSTLNFGRLRAAPFGDVPETFERTVYLQTHATDTIAVIALRLITDCEATFTARHADSGEPLTTTTSRSDDPDISWFPSTERALLIPPNGCMPITVTASCHEFRTGRVGCILAALIVPARAALEQDPKTIPRIMPMLFSTSFVTTLAAYVEVLPTKVLRTSTDDDPASAKATAAKMLAVEAKSFRTKYLETLFTDRQPHEFVRCRSALEDVPLISWEPGPGQDVSLHRGNPYYASIKRDAKAAQDMPNSRLDFLTPSTADSFSTPRMEWMRQQLQHYRLLTLDWLAEQHLYRTFDAFHVEAEWVQIRGYWALQLKVQGVEDARPAVSVGDCMYVKYAAVHLPTIYVARVVDVNAARALVSVEMPDERHFSKTTVHVRFLPSDVRHTLCVMALSRIIVSGNDVPPMLPPPRKSSAHDLQAAQIQYNRTEGYQGNGKYIPKRDANIVSRRRIQYDRKSRKERLMQRSAHDSVGIVEFAGDDDEPLTVPSVPTRRRMPLNDAQEAAVRGFVTSFRRRLAVTPTNNCEYDLGTSPISLLFGPPGTGKTRTVVEIAARLLAEYSTIRILLVAPAPYAADALASALGTRRGGVGLTEGEMLRINEPNRIPATVKEDVLRYTLPVSNLPPGSCTFYQPPTDDDVKFARALVCTTLSSHLVTALAWRPDVILIDEAAQASVPETLIPLSLMEGGTSALLAGDPYQLGPRVFSRIAFEHGLGKSMLEHWLEYIKGVDRKVEAENCIDRIATPLCSRLCANYRSHPDVLQLLSRLFYGNAVYSAADVANFTLPEGWRDLCLSLGQTVTAGGGAQLVTPAATPRVCFLGIQGTTSRVGYGDASPSLFNAEEANALVTALVSYLQMEGCDTNSVGVVCTFRKQVQLIRLMLRERGLGAIRVGTISDYQGQEEKVLFVSTVYVSTRRAMRAAGGPPKHAKGGGDADPNHYALEQLMQAPAPELLGSTSAAHAGHHRRFEMSPPPADGTSVFESFLVNPRSFNVVMSRAKALTVVFGHPATLASCGDHWRQLLAFSFDRGWYFGQGYDAMMHLQGGSGSGVVGGGLPQTLGAGYHFDTAVDPPADEYEDDHFNGNAPTARIEL